MTTPPALSPDLGRASRLGTPGPDLVRATAPARPLHPTGAGAAAGKLAPRRRKPARRTFFTRRDVCKMLGVDPSTLVTLSKYYDLYRPALRMGFNRHSYCQYHRDQVALIIRVASQPTEEAQELDRERASREWAAIHARLGYEVLMDMDLAARLDDADPDGS